MFPQDFLGVCSLIVENHIDSKFFQEFDLIIRAGWTDDFQAVDFGELDNEAADSTWHVCEECLRSNNANNYWATYRQQWTQRRFSPKLRISASFSSNKNA